MYFNISNGHIDAYDSCNYVSFNYQSEKQNQIKFDVTKAMSTLRGCFDDNSSILSKKWKEMLSKVNKYEITSEKLYFRDNDNKTLASLVRQSNELVGVRWQAHRYNTGGGVEWRGDMPNIWILLKLDGTVEGKGECLPIIGTYQIDKSQRMIRFNVQSTSIERCAKNSDALRRQNILIKNMNASLKYYRTGNNLELRDSKGVMTISASAINTELPQKNMEK